MFKWKQNLLTWKIVESKTLDNWYTLTVHTKKTPDPGYNKVATVKADLTLIMIPGGDNSLK